MTEKSKNDILMKQMALIDTYRYRRVIWDPSPCGFGEDADAYLNQSQPIMSCFKQKPLKATGERLMLS